MQIGVRLVCLYKHLCYPNSWTVDPVLLSHTWLAKWKKSWRKDVPWRAAMLRAIQLVQKMLCWSAIKKWPGELWSSVQCACSNVCSIQYSVQYCRHFVCEFWQGFWKCSLELFIVYFVSIRFASGRAFVIFVKVNFRYMKSNFFVFAVIFCLA